MLLSIFVSRYTVLKKKSYSKQHDLSTLGVGPHKIIIFLNPIGSLHFKGLVSDHLYGTDRVFPFPFFFFFLQDLTMFEVVCINQCWCQSIRDRGLAPLWPGDFKARPYDTYTPIPTHICTILHTHVWCNYTNKF